VSQESKVRIVLVLVSAVPFKKTGKTTFEIIHNWGLENAVSV
jgi:hypothetical protein